MKKLSLVCLSGDLKKYAAQICRLQHQVMTKERYINAEDKATVRDYIQSAYEALVEAYEYTDSLCDTQP